MTPEEEKHARTVLTAAHELGHWGRIERRAGKLAATGRLSSWSL